VKSADDSPRMQLPLSPLNPGFTVSLIRADCSKSLNQEGLTGPAGGVSSDFITSNTFWRIRMEDTAFELKYNTVHCHWECIGEFIIKSEKTCVPPDEINGCEDVSFFLEVVTLMLPLHIH